MNDGLPILNHFYLYSCLCHCLWSRNQTELCTQLENIRNHSPVPDFGVPHPTPVVYGNHWRTLPRSSPNTTDPLSRRPSTFPRPPFTVVNTVGRKDSVKVTNYRSILQRNHHQNVWVLCKLQYIHHRLLFIIVTTKSRKGKRIWLKLIRSICSIPLSF